VDYRRRSASEKTICYQNDFIEDMLRFRDDGPDNDEVINQVPGQIPADYFDGT